MRRALMPRFKSKSRRKDSGKRGSTKAATNGLNSLEQLCKYLSCLLGRFAEVSFRHCGRFLAFTSIRPLSSPITEHNPD